MENNPNTGAFSYPNSDHSADTSDTTPAPVRTEPARAAEMPGSRPFSYGNSDHRGERRSAPESRPPPGEIKPFSYPATNAPKPHGVRDELVPEEVRELRAQDSDRRIFSAQGNYRDSGLRELVDSMHELSPDDRATVTAEYKEMFADLQFSAPEARDFVSLIKQTNENPPDPATEQRWQAAGYTRLVELYGKSGADKALDLARQLVQRDPRVAGVLDVSRLGNHPKVIEQLARVAMQERIRGRV